MEINLISDTVTKPTKQMLEAMFAAEVGDDVFNADPTVNALQDKVARLFGMEAALFFPSGTMANQVAIKIHTHPGDRIFCDKWAHVYNFEGGGIAFNSGVTSKLIDGERGMFTATQLATAVTGRADIHVPYSKLVAIENTTNKGGGACWEISELQKIKKVCNTNNLKLHLDGARLFNALVAKQQDPKQFGEIFDTISICLSKGLGCPVGSLLLGSKKQIQQAFRVRKLFGGGMRQVGYLASAGIYALDNHVERLAEDHQKAKQIGRALEVSAAIKSVEPIETNIVIFYAQNETYLLESFKKASVLITSMGEGKLRIVTHLDFTEAMHKKVLQIIASL